MNPPIAEPALRGLTVLDASRVLAGPYCSMLLADLGATVIKVERPPSGDDTRSWGPPYLGDPDQGLSAYFLSVNRGKQSVCVDLQNPSGRELMLDMVHHADVLIENFAPGVAARLGLGPEAIEVANPKIVHASITAFGDQPGPGYDLAIQGMSGLMAITGEEHGPPMKVGVAITDVIAGLQAAHAILAAIVARGRTGRGDHITISLLGSAVACLVNVGQAHLISGAPAQRWGNAHAQIVPYQVFASVDGHLTVAAGNDKLYASLCQVIGRQDLVTDARYRTNPDRVTNRASLIPVLEEIFAQKRTSEWLEALNAVRVPCGPVSGLQELFAGPEAPAGVEMQTLATGAGTTYETVGPPVSMAGRRGQLTGAPLVGEHTDQVLCELLGLDPERLAQLHAAGAIQ
jgi:crotonobetainyl-CoA:carnitine CoA-transferase CaiB-like acyl-CoA transferase